MADEGELDLRSLNDDELVPLIEYGRTVNAEVRFIEYMDVGGATSGDGEGECERLLGKAIRYFSEGARAHDGAGFGRAHRRG